MRRLLARLGWRDRDAEIRAEIEAHLQMAIRERIERGEDPVRARDAAAREFGNVPLVRTATRGVWSGVAFEQLLQDIRFGVRILRTSPALSATAIFLIALVIGGNTTIFAMIHTLVSKPAAGITADNLIIVGIAGRPGAGEHSYPDFRDYQRQVTTLEPIFGFGFDRVTIGLDDSNENVHATLVEPNYFEGLGVRLAKGRTFLPHEYEAGSPIFAIIGHRIWRDHYQSAEDIVGRALVVNGLPATIVGVTPVRFIGAMLGERAEVWVPLRSYFRARGHQDQLEARGRPLTMVMGRRKAGISTAAIQTELTTISQRLAIDHPATNRDRVAAVVPYGMAAGTLIGDQSHVFLAAFSVITFLTLIIVAANVANLMLARAVAQQRETAVRQSLGASRGRIIRMLAIEGLTIALLAWAASCAIAVMVVRVVLRLLPAGAEGVGIDPSFAPDWQVAGYAMLLAALATVAFTLAPALRTWKQQVLPPLKAGEQSVAAGRSRVASTLVVMQLAFSVVLLTSAGLAYRSFSLIKTVDLGFEPRGLLLVSANVGAAATSKDQNLQLLGRIADRLRTIPGVLDVGYARSAPRLGPAETPVRASLAQEPPLLVRHKTIGDGYLAALGVGLRAGRDFTPRDDRASAPVVVVSQTLAEDLWPGANAVGQTILIGREARAHQVVGVIAPVLFEGFRREARPYYVLSPDSQQAVPAPQPVFYVRHDGALERVAPAASAAIRDVDRAVSIGWERTMEVQLEEVNGPFAVVMALLLIFSGVSLLIASVGQYAVVAFDMRRRTREFGVRLALGASGAQVLRSVIREGLALTAVGLVVGFVLSAGTGTALARQFYGITGTDAPTYAGVFVILASAALLACYIPARRAARVNPVEALRQE